MTEVYHFKSLSGRDFVAVFQDRYLNAAANRYAERYAAGLESSHCTLPAVPLQVVWPDMDNCVGYKDMIYIDNITDPDDPVMVCAWDFYLGENRIGNHGEYTRTIP